MFAEFVGDGKMPQARRDPTKNLAELREDEG